MTTDEIRAIVKSSITRITSIAPEEILDDASYKSDLQLDSLTILEIAVDAEYQFKIKIPEDELGTIDTVEDTVTMVQQHLNAGASG
jgi:acyl carrier protein